MASIPQSELGPILSAAGVQIVGIKACYLNAFVTMSQTFEIQYAVLASYVVLVYDHLLTIRDEINYIWKRRFSAVTVLFFINRYYCLCAATIVLFAELSTVMDFEKCMRFVLFQPLGEGVPFTFFPDIVIGLRVYALYGRNKAIAVILTIYIIAELGVALWIYLTPSTHPTTLPGPPEVFDIPVLHLCIATKSTKLGNLQAASFQFMQTIYDSAVFGLIVYKTVKDALDSRSSVGGIRALMARHGVLYYAVMFSANLTWAMMILFSPPALQYSAAAPTFVLACMSVNRMTLSLRSYGEPQAVQTDTMPWNAQPRFNRRRSWIGTSTFEIGAGHVQDSLPVDFDSFELQSQQTGTTDSSDGSLTQRVRKD